MNHPLHLDISGMSCGHCVMAVRKGLKQVDGVLVRQVDVGAADLDYDESKTSPDVIVKAVEDAGFTVTSQA